MTSVWQFQTAREALDKASHNQLPRVQAQWIYVTCMFSGHGSFTGQQVMQKMLVTNNSSGSLPVLVRLYQFSITTGSRGVLLFLCPCKRLGAVSNSSQRGEKPPEITVVFLTEREFNLGNGLPGF